MDRLKRLAALAKLQIEKARARWGGVDIAVRTFKRYSEDDGGSYAAALTYYTFFSIFPLLLFAAAALGYVTHRCRSTSETRRERAEHGPDPEGRPHPGRAKDDPREPEQPRGHRCGYWPSTRARE